MSLFDYDNTRAAQAEVLAIMVGNQPTMNSLEIADLLESRHDSVKRAIERCVASNTIVHPPAVDEQSTDAMGRTRRTSVFYLDKRSSLIVVAQMSPKFTARIIDRWQELEAKNSSTSSLQSALDRNLGIAKMLAHKVTNIEKALPDMVNALIEPLLAARLAEGRLILRNGKTAKQIWDNAGLPGGIKGSAAWFGNRLQEMGCGVGRGEQASTSVRLFDPDKAALCLRNGLLQTARRYADERKGQGRFRLHSV